MKFLQTFRAKLLTCMFALALVAVLIGVYGIVQLWRLNDRTAVISDVLVRRVLHTGEVQAAFSEYVRNQKNIVVDTDPNNVSKWLAGEDKARSDLKKALDDWKEVASDKGKVVIGDLEKELGQYFAASEDLNRLAKQGNRAEAAALSVRLANTYYAGTIARIDEGRQLAVETIRAEAEDSKADYISTRNWQIAILLLGLGSGLWLALFQVNGVCKRVAEVTAHINEVAEGDGDLTRRIAVDSQDELGVLSQYFNNFMDKLQKIISQVAGSAEQIASASEQISSSATQVAHSAETQRDQTTQVSTAMQEMASTVQQVSEHANQASESARNSREVAAGGGETVQQTVQMIRDVADAVRDTAAKIEKLGKSSDQIGQIIGVIDDIADQTNLLALNAAIEAARAGEQGRGFAVVADEVRKLAERTTQATKEIATMIKTIQDETHKAVDAMNAGTSKVENGVQSALHAGDALQKIISGAETVQDMITHIATAATEQASATEQVNCNMEQIAKMVQQSAIGADESAKACQELSTLAFDLQQTISHFKIGEAKQSARPGNQRKRMHVPPRPSLDDMSISSHTAVVQ